MLTLDRQELGKIDRARLLERFALAERHVREGARHVARQREIVAQLKGRLLHQLASVRFFRLMPEGVMPVSLLMWFLVYHHRVAPLPVLGSALILPCPTTDPTKKPTTLASPTNATSIRSRSGSRDGQRIEGLLFAANGLRPTVV